MAKGEVVIKESKCLGCGYCVEFCSQGCLAITGEKVSPEGYLLPVLVAPEKCTGCGICSWMCPSFAIDVYQIVGV